MIKEGKIGVQEAVCLLIIVLNCKLFFTSPSLSSRLVGTTTWLMTIISCVTAICGFTFTYLLLKRFPGKDLIEIFNIILGRYVGSLFSLILFLVFMESAGILIREFVEVMIVYNFPATPPEFLASIFLVVIGVMVYLGLESIARTARLLAPWMLLGYLLLLVLAAQNYHLSFLFPIFGNGLGKTVTVGMSRSSVYGEIVLVGVIATALQGTDHIRKIAYSSLIISGVLAVMGMLAFTLVFPYFVTQELTAPIYDLSRTISYGTFLQRLDPIFVVIWNLTTFITVAALFYAALSIFCKVFRLDDTRPVIIPLTIILYAVAGTPPDLPTLVEFYGKVLRETGWVFFYGMPLVVWVTAILRGKKGTSNNG